MSKGGDCGGRAAFLWVLIQILLLDIVFSLDSVITAVGMANRLSIMVTAMVLAMLVSLSVTSAYTSVFILVYCSEEKNPKQKA